MNLDTSWIEKEEKINSIQQHYVRELPEKINLYYVYIDENDSIQNVEKETEVLVHSKISKERLLQIIQTKRMVSHIHGGTRKYKLFDILTYQVHLDPEKIFFFSKTENLSEITEYSQSFFRSVPLFDEITIVPSIFIFHEINAIYFLFKPCVSHPLRSILKTDSSSIKKENRVTKKVRISLDSVDSPIDAVETPTPTADAETDHHTPKTMKHRPDMTKHTRKNKSVLQ